MARMKKIIMATNSVEKSWYYRNFREFKIPKKRDR